MAGAGEAATLRGRAATERGDLAGARAVLAEAAAAAPGAVAPRAALMQVLVRAGAGPAELEPATRAVPAADPGHGQAQPRGAAEGDGAVAGWDQPNSPWDVARATGP